MNQGRIYATYLIETGEPVERAVELMAGEQSVGTFVEVPGESAELRARYGARIERITILETVDRPSLPCSNARPARDYTRAEVELSFPLETVGTSLTSLVTTVAGNLFELSPFSGIRLIGVDVPDAFAAAHPGPQFGVAGTRRLAGAHDRPIIGTIVKPSVGLSPRETADLVRTLCDAGLDFIKDDELQADSPHSPFEERVREVMRVINDHADRTGRKVMYAFNISADADGMLRHHDLVVASGGTCAMVNLLAVGLAAVQKLRRHSRLALHGHRAGWGALSRHPRLGLSYPALQKVYRLAGVDHLHVNGLRNKFCESDASVLSSARACLAPLGGGRPAMPVFSSGQTAAQIPDTFDALGNSDFIFLAGGGIMAHPGGPAEGAQSLREAWEATRAGIPLADYARSHAALERALERFGGR